ncbi:hypothetical protein D3X12_14035 [Pseudomonas protegens]|uniref:Uncharacterized protein n=1 Tax=Pseudomonas protegens TaxID=380021 RepID=A0ABY2VGR3_9PSED|nr:hypothetical protein CEP86_30735 [Pseudomonas protegens]MDT9640980.1 hypothetical protein [Pseudomonas sp. JV245A]OBZ26142.1 hypothetical protein BBH58_11920 [Pseudomonas protegens]OBZ29032.1 hypothetical protein BBH57_03770 [Pseudomonas protegens]OKK39058.1 hypothetical protein BS643_27655 [Pseudomonas protegens]
MQTASLYAGLFIAWRFFRGKVGEDPLFARELFGLFIKMFSVCFGIFLSQFVISNDMFLIPTQTGLRIQR